MEGLCYETLAEDRVLAILPKGHPIAARAVTDESGLPAIRLDWLLDETFILQNRHQRLGQYILG